MSRTPLGLTQPYAPNFDVTLSPDGQVVLHRRYLSYPPPRETGGVDRWTVSPADAARFRAALVRYRPAESLKSICGGKVYDGPVLARMPVFGIEWEGATSRHDLAVCYLAQEEEIIEAIQHGLAALHLTLEGNRF